MTSRKCPRCGHENVARALFCFQCGRNLETSSAVRGVPNTGRLIEDALRFIKKYGQGLEPGLVSRLKEAHTKLPPTNLEGEPLTCLRCGTFNVPSAHKCIGCGSDLVVPDSDFNILPLTNARTSVGQVRINNEDRVSLWALDGVVLGLVADGLGGAAAGEEASRLAAEAIQADFLGEQRGGGELLVMTEAQISQRMIEAIVSANEAVVERAAENSALKGMGTTTTLALIRGNRAIIAHVGDSRTYLIDGQEGWINQITVDHSFVQALLASGHITPDQAINHPMGSILYRALGQSSDLEVDIYTRYIKAGDSLVLCSDGLTRHLQAEEIAAIVKVSKTPHEATQKLVELANQRGGEDNVSVIVVMLEPVADGAAPGMAGAGL